MHVGSLPMLDIYCDCNLVPDKREQLRADVFVLITKFRKYFTNNEINPHILRFLKGLLALLNNQSEKDKFFK